MLSNHLAALPVIIPLVGAPLCLLLWYARLAWIFTVAVTGVLTFLSFQLVQQVQEAGVMVYYMGGWLPPYGIELKINIINAWLLVLLNGMAFLASIYAYYSVKSEVPRSKQAAFYAMFLLCLTGLAGIISSNDAFNLYVFLEISSLATYALIALGKDRRSLMAAFEYLILGTVGATFYLIAVGLLYMSTGTLNFTDLAVRVPALMDQLPVQAAIAFFAIGIMLKTAMFPMHIWLANSYTNAPSFVSVFLSATATKVSVYVLIKLLYEVFLPQGQGLDPPLAQKVDVLSVTINVLMVLSVLAMIICGVWAVMQHNMKRLLAYSSVAQLGYIVLAICLLNESALQAAMVHMWAHGLAKGGLFMVCGSLMYRVGSVRFKDIQGAGHMMPVTGFVAIICGLSMIGVPLTAGFISKWYLLSGLMEAEQYLLLVAMVISSLLALAYVWKIMEALYLLEPSAKVRVTAKDPPLMMLLPMLAIVGLTLWLGINSTWSLELAKELAQQILPK